jgi:polar amino acid transport system permease protein
MSAEVVEARLAPRHDLPWARRESRPASVVAFALGTSSIVVLLGGSIVVAVIHGLTPVSVVIDAITSPALATVNITAVVLGGAATLIGASTYRRMPTRLARNEAVAGAILGVQALLLGGFFYWFSTGNVQTFATNFLNFAQVKHQAGAFVTGAKNTLILAFAGEFFGTIFGLILSVFTISKRAALRAPARVYINFFRGTPLVWQISFVGLSIPIAFPGFTFLQGASVAYRAAIIALTLNAAAYTAEIFRAGIESIERGQLEAARGLGMSYLQAMRYSIIPQAIRRVIPPLMNEFVILIKDTSLVFILGLSFSQRDLMSVGQQGYGTTFNASFFVATALGYLAVTLPMIGLVNRIEKRLRSGLVGVTA